MSEIEKILKEEMGYSPMVDGDEVIEELTSLIEKKEREVAHEINSLGKRYKNEKYSTDQFVIHGKKWDKYLERFEEEYKIVGVNRDYATESLGKLEANSSEANDEIRKEAVEGFVEYWLNENPDEAEYLTNYNIAKEQYLAEKDLPTAFGHELVGEKE